MSERAPLRRARSAEAWNAAGAEMLPGLLGLEVVEVARGRARLRLDLRPHHLAPNGFLHAAVVVGLADTASGYGCLASLPEDASGFTTVELKSNFLSTRRDGALGCDAVLVHGGRTTQLWDATVVDEASGRVVALFRCTQLVLRD